jgi:flagellar motor switch protein FliM
MANILSDEEIDKLLTCIENDDYTETRNIRLYDFKRPQILTKYDLRKIRNLHDKNLIDNLRKELKELMILKFNYILLIN